MKINSSSVKLLSKTCFFLSGAILTGTLINIENATAQSTSVGFTGTAAATCSINSTTSGSMVLSADGLSLAATSSAGTPGSINVTCNGGTTVTINSITDTSEQANGIEQAAVAVMDGESVVVNANSLSLIPPQTSSLLSGPIENQNYNVELTLSNNSSLIVAGTYSYTVGITLTPQ